MSRSSLLLVALFTISFMFFLGYAYPTHSGSAAGVKDSTVAAAPFSPRAEVAQQRSVAYSEASSSPATSPDMVAKWIAEAFDADPKIRAAAIAALAIAPRSQVVLVLQRILNAGEPSVDRPLALRSLRILALQQGDVDGGIRDTFRQAIYDGSDETITPGAQAALADVESYLDQIGPNASR